MKTFKPNHFITALALITSLTLSQPTDTNTRQKTVVITNDIPGESITTKCHTSKERLDNRTIPNGANFNFGFRATKLYCDFTTSHGSGSYSVLTSRLGNPFVWLVRRDGPCLQGADKSLYCRAWKVAHRLRNGKRVDEKLSFYKMVRKTKRKKLALYSM